MKFGNPKQVLHSRRFKRVIIIVIAIVFAIVAFWPTLKFDDKKAFGDWQMIGIGAFLIMFSASYIGRSNWTGTIAGRALAYLVTSWAVFTVWVSLSTSFGQAWFTGWVEVRIGVYGAVFLTVFNMCWTLLEIQSGHIQRDSSSYEDASSHK